MPLPSWVCVCWWGKSLSVFGPFGPLPVKSMQQQTVPARSVTHSVCLCVWVEESSGTDCYTLRQNHQTFLIFTTSFLLHLKSHHQSHFFSLSHSLLPHVLLFPFPQWPQFPKISLYCFHFRVRPAETGHIRQYKERKKCVLVSFFLKYYSFVIFYKIWHFINMFKCLFYLIIIYDMNIFCTIQPLLCRCPGQNISIYI